MKILLSVVVIALILLSGCKGNTLAVGGDGSGSQSSGEEKSSTSSAVASSTTEVPSESSVTGSNSDVSSAPITTTITIPEGYTLARIAMVLEEKGICSVEDFINAAETGDFSEFSLIAQQSADETRCFDLEGYLFPDTYEIYTDDTPDAIIRRFLSHTEQMLSSDIRAGIAASGYTVDQIITMASIIEKESLGQAEMANISSVLHNRLNEGLQLKCDVTIVYVEGAIKPFISGDINRYNSYYNTYKCAALPSGAICNPGIDAIQAAINPAATNYYFFFTDPNKVFHYSENGTEHEQQMAEYGLG